MVGCHDGAVGSDHKTGARVLYLSDRLLWLRGCRACSRSGIGLGLLTGRCRTLRSRARYGSDDVGHLEGEGTRFSKRQIYADVYVLPAEGCLSRSDYIVETVSKSGAPVDNQLKGSPHLDGNLSVTDEALKIDRPGR